MDRKGNRVAVFRDDGRWRDERLQRNILRRQKCSEDESDGDQRPNSSPRSQKAGVQLDGEVSDRLSGICPLRPRSRTLGIEANEAYAALAK
jgi:hypothetical protein